MSEELDTRLAAEIDAVAASRSRGRGPLQRLMLCGDWRTRALAQSAGGAMIRDDPTAWRRFSLLGRALAFVPHLCGMLPTVGRHGFLISPSLVNGLSDSCWQVRTAAALAVGECRDPRHSRVLEALLNDPFRPPRLAAATALRARGAPTGELRLEQCETTPPNLDGGSGVLDWLSLIAGRHLALLSQAAPAPSPRPRDAAGWAEWLAGPIGMIAIGGRQAEIRRYGHEPDLKFQLAKPFSDEDRMGNLRQLEAFVAATAELSAGRGAWVLDLGGGPGWVSELLIRFGLRVVTLDVSSSLLRLAKTRFDGAGLAGRPVCGDMTSLPFEDNSFEAAIVLDSLHHVENVELVLREACRVLVPGGRLVVAEPGEGHMESPKSRAEMHEQGVREGEIHLFALERLARRAGFTDLRAVLRPPLGVHIDPAGIRRAMRDRLDRWLVELDGRSTTFDSLVLRTTLDRPIVTLTAGERMADSRAPALARARIVPALSVHTGRLVGRVEISNKGDTLWLSATPDGIGAVSLGLQLLHADGGMRDRELARFPLPADVAPGETVSLAIALDLPALDEPALVKLDLVAEHVCWFEDRGSRPAMVEVGAQK
jgi:ubiquinone/menaquinone biosynthesis C-methylase UbiE